MNINVMFAGMSLKNWYFRPVLKILHARNAKARIPKSSYLHLVRGLLLTTPFLPCRRPGAAEVPAFREAKDFLPVGRINKKTG